MYCYLVPLSAYYTLLPVSLQRLLLSRNLFARVLLSVEGIELHPPTLFEEHTIQPSLPAVLRQLTLLNLRKN